MVLPFAKSEKLNSEGVATVEVGIMFLVESGLYNHVWGGK